MIDFCCCLKVAVVMQFYMMASIMSIQKQKSVMHFMWTPVWFTVGIKAISPESRKQSDIDLLLLIIIMYYNTVAACFRIQKTWINYDWYSHCSTLLLFFYDLLNCIIAVYKWHNDPKEKRKKYSIILKSLCLLCDTITDD